MTNDTPAIKKWSAKDIPVAGLRVWYHLPFSYDISQEFDLEQHGWKPISPSCSLQQRHYVHSFVGNALWDQPDSKTALFDHFTRKSIAQTGFHAVFRTCKKEKVLVVRERHDYIGRLLSVELRRLKPNEIEGKATTVLEGIGILVVCVEFETVANSKYLDDESEPDPQFAPLKLADAQDILNLSRRFFPRWHGDDDPTLPGDAFASVECAGPAPSRAQMEAGAASGRTPIMPWVEQMIAPYLLDGNGSDHFGDERAFVTSAILVGDGTEGWGDDRRIVARIEESDLFRLAELDSAGEDYAYNRDFLELLKPSYLYVRQAPDTTARTGASTYYLTAQHHLSVIGAGKFFRDEILGRPDIAGGATGHVAEYYRHMQFLCVFEYYRLIQFSKALTRLVRDRPDDVEFGRQLMKIRHEFLEFTHLHHFSNISTQLQPRELFARLYSAFELKDIFEEVEKELDAATSFHEITLAQAERENGARLNRLISTGVPLSLIVGAGGMNVLIGDNAPGFLGAGKKGLDLLSQLAQLGVITTVTAGIWAVADKAINKSRASNWWVRISVISFFMTVVFANLAWKLR